MRELRAVWLTDTLVLLLIQVNHPSIVCFGSGQVKYTPVITVTLHKLFREPHCSPVTL